MYEDNSQVGNVANNRSIEADLTTFVGRTKEYYYMPRFENMLDRDSKVGWNWPAFFVPTLWMAYRKMYVYAGILLGYQILSVILDTVLGVPFISSIFNVLNILVFIGVPLFANYIYFKFACKSIDSCNDIYNEEERRDKISSLGGTNKKAVFIMIAINIVYFIATFSVYYSTFTNSFN